ncbi:type VI secretion system contractile sheath large subunit [Fodinicurvata sp. EGI_FJ10296]|uniref:type VI secretion system contractile sheath large subunit n=1 Tax=Fodinicurvata sp. EGI_FJ10296 TaxID=3231908 RepID=UPI003455123B
MSDGRHTGPAETLEPRDAGGPPDDGAGAGDGPTERSAALPKGGLRSVLFAEAHRPTPAIDAFLDARAPEDVLAQWFGARLEDLRDAPDRLMAMLVRDIAEIDEAITRQLNAILHHRRFQRLEATWRGVALIVSESDGIENAVIRVLNVRWPEIARDLDRAVEFDQSQLFSKIYSEEFDMPGGTPYGLLIADFEVAHKPRPGTTVDDVSVLTGLSQIAMAAFAPIVIGCAPELFGLETFREFGLPIDVRAVLDQQEYRRFNRLRETEESRFLALVVPHILLRRPYSPTHDGEIGFPYREDWYGANLRTMLWGNAGYAYATVVLRAFGQYGWFADIRGARRDEMGGGIVDCLPNISFATDRQGIASKYCTDVSITDKVENDLNSLGFIALANAKDTPYAIFYGNQSVHMPKDMSDAAATANERLSSMIRYVLCISRFAHYVKIMVRDRVGRFETPETIEDHLSRWLMNYTTANDRASEEMKARYPLRDGVVQVRDVPGKPGAYRCVINVQPHFQLDQVVSSFRLVTELNAIGAGS